MILVLIPIATYFPPPLCVHLTCLLSQEMFVILGLSFFLLVSCLLSFLECFLAFVYCSVLIYPLEILVFKLCLILSFHILCLLLFCTSSWIYSILILLVFSQSEFFVFEKWTYFSLSSVSSSNAVQKATAFYEHFL